MTVKAMPLNEITVSAIRILCREIGAVNTVRFIQQFTMGTGDYTQERDRIIGEQTVDEIVAEIKQMRRFSGKNIVRVNG